MSLEEYRRKRNFGLTKEPKGKVGKGRKEPIFVIQKHDASRLHYDFRLEMDGTLKSWAVPKGPPYEKGEKHLAIQVEDHPLEYGGFEGTIPEGQYGGGTVMLWDIGTYEPGGPDELKALKDGRLHFALHGKKLEGEWALVRIRGEDDQWLLLKAGEDMKPISARRDDQSALSGRTMKAIANAHDAEWQSHRVEKGKPSLKEKIRAKARAHAEPAPKTKTKPKKGKAKLKFVEPMMAKLEDEAPSKGDWLYELKFDGFRALALKDGDEVQLLSRNEKSLAEKFPEVVEAVRALPVETAMLDGEVVALDKRGHSSFQLLQGLDMRDRPPIVYYLFDLLNLEGEDLQHEPLEKRKEKLEALLAGQKDPLRFSASLGSKAEPLLKKVKKLGLEGLIGKRAGSLYEVGRRSGAWIKVKCLNEQEFVIGGFTPPSGTREKFGSLLLGYYEGKKLVFCGKVGTGFNRKLLKSVHQQMMELKTKECPFVNLPESGPQGKWNQKLTPAEFRKCTWVKPRLVCQIKFGEWTGDGKLRQPVFLGLREDKEARKVKREIAG